LSGLPLLQWSYAGPILVALTLPLVWPSGRTYTEPGDRRRYRILQILTLLGALVGAKLGVMMGDVGWPVRRLEDPWQILLTGRSLVGGFLFGFLTAEVLKPRMGHRHPPNDHFARTLAFSIAIGRLGCLMTGCCRGLPWDGPWAIADVAGVLRHPAPLYEIVFHSGIGLVFSGALSRGRWRGTFFARYLIAYGVFRLMTEFLRETPRFLDPFTVYQLLCLLMIGCGVWAMRRYGPSPMREMA